MIKARNRKLSMLLVLAMLMTMFVGVGTASAASVTYSVEKAADVTISKPTDTAGKDLGIIMVKVPDVTIIDTAYANAEFISVSLPEGLKFNATPYGGVGSGLPLNGTPFIEVDTAKVLINADLDYLPNITGDGRTLNFNVTRTNTSAKEDTTIKIKLNDIWVNDASGDLSVLIGGPRGSIFPQTALTLGKAVSKGSTTASAKSVKSMGDDGTTLDTFIIMENMAGTLKNGDKVKVRLPNGFTWANAPAPTPAPTVVGDWGLAGKVSVASNTPMGSRDLEFTLNVTPSVGTAGRITLNNLFVNVDDTNRTGDVEVEVSGTNITTQSVVVAKYGTFGVTLTESTVKDLTAGKNDRELGAFIIEEDIAESLVVGRTITMELPSGVKWEKGPEVVVNKGRDLTSGWTLVNGSKDRIIKTTVSASSKTAAKNLFEKGKVYIEPGFEGPIEVIIGGTAGVEGKIKVAEVQPAVKITAENVKNIGLGTQSQQVGDILIVESAKEAILRGTNQDKIVVGIDAGYTFSKKPRVEVIEGDLEIDSTKLNSASDEITITIKYNSSKPSTIKISDVYLTGLRYAPEGPVKAFLVEAEGVVGSAATGSTALDAGWRGFSTNWLTNAELSEVSAGEVVIANCVTAAPSENVGNGEFRIGSNIYYVGGAAKVMDVAPYIKDSRTYVPMRYVAEILGAEVVWDEAARTVTLTKGDDVAVFTISSTTYTVNGEAMTADVAPEITNSRTMLPARFVAEAFGAVVGWDAGTQTVLIQQ